MGRLSIARPSNSNSWQIIRYRSNRNYHIFYYVYYGLKKDGLASQYFLDGRNSFRFLPIGDTEAEINYYLSGYQKLKDHLEFWDMERTEQDFIFKTIAAILLIGQITFDDENGTAFVSNPNILNNGILVLRMACSICIYFYLPL